MIAMASFDELDSGLLAPVRAGTPVEALTTDRAFLQAMLDVEVALTRAQARLGAVPEPVVATIAAAADADHFDLRGLALKARASANPVVAVVEALMSRVAAVDPGAADFVHRGSTSQDVLDTAIMLVAARSLRAIGEDLDRVTSAAAALAVEHRDTPMAGRTLAQHAVPVTFGLKAAGWLQVVGRAAGKLRRVADTELVVEAGGAAGTLAGYLAYLGDDVDPAEYVPRFLRAFADEAGLGVPVLPWHTDRTSMVEVGWALAAVTGALGKIAGDVRTLSRTEIGELAEPAAAGRGGSSAMPQKRNPVLSALILSAAQQIGPLAGGLTQSMLADDERPAGAWQAEWQPLRECLRLAGGAAHAAAELVEGLEVDAGRMRANLGLTGGLIVSERVAAALTPLLGKAAAKRVTARAALAAAGGERTFLAELAAAPELDGRVQPGFLDPLVDPLGYLGAAGVLVDRALAHFDARPEPRSTPCR